VPITDDDELLMMTSRGKIQRVAAKEINIIGRNTQGVRIMKLDEDDTLTAIVKVPKEDVDEADAILAPSAAPLSEEATDLSAAEDDPSVPEEDSGADSDDQSNQE
jgi:DNA gyrase subunit A